MKVTQWFSHRPYLLRAFYEWLLDNQLTPYLVVDVSVGRVIVPIEFSRHGKIVLNIAPRAVENLAMDNDTVRLNARFGGVPRQVVVPMQAIIAVYARENGVGMMFEPKMDEDHANKKTHDTVMAVISGDRSDDTHAEHLKDDPLMPLRSGHPSLRVVK